jgi:hypothetical protein
MKIKLFNLPEYDIDIKAYENGKVNNDKLFGFLNEISLMARYSAEFQKCQGHYYISEEYKEVSNTLYEICKKAGFYNDIA